MQKEWDLNIFFEDLGLDEDGENQWDNVITINPAIWTKYDDGRTDTHWTDIIWKTTFAEARYLRSEYPESEYGDDWTDTLDNFLKIAPPRLQALARTLPSPHDVNGLVG
mgnify:CR=1 FL=1